jgi:hypothetical protein
MKPPLASVTIPRWDGTPRAVADCWTLRQGAHVACCRFWTHPKGGEARLSINGECQRTSVAIDGRTLLDVALDWKEQFEEVGWC